MEKQVKTSDKGSRLAVISSHLVTPQIPMAAASEKEAALAAVPSDSPTMYFPCLLLSLFFFFLFLFLGSDSSSVLSFYVLQIT